jgi:murein DD-endopeptidase MepM/ murein hydrolase activator NlpD
MLRRKVSLASPKRLIAIRASPTATREPQATSNPTPAAGGSSFLIWPTHGPISSYFGPRHPLGIDIDLYHDPNAPIAAAKGGTVTFAGGNPCCSYGYHIILDHGNGYETLYAHLNQFAVANGEWVKRGQLIAYSGNTGRSTGPHLHFEVRRNGQWVDPMGYLP